MLAAAWKLASTLHRQKDHRHEQHWRAVRLLASTCVIGALAALLPVEQQPQPDSDSDEQHKDKKAKADDGSAVVTSPKEKDDKNHEADDPLAPILGAANAIFQRDGLRFKPAEAKADNAGAVVDRISMPVLRAEMVALAQGLQTALGELRLKGQLRSSVQVAAAPLPDTISQDGSSSHKIPFLREFLGAPTADELVWHLPTLADALYEACTVHQQQQHTRPTRNHPLPATAKRRATTCRTSIWCS